ncbi:enoyl-CoA hydratase/isomerase family protein [Minwuia thermotolerans]|nr:enoyl-CoA hydratase/isomerase family protein [Minwuia thermotolerans]
MSEEMAVDWEGDIALLRLQRAPVNALDIDYCETVTRELIALAADGRACAAVLTGRGDCFSAGADLKTVPHYDAGEQRTMLRVLNRLFHAAYRLPVPLVAAVNGHAIAGGLVLALAADYRVAVDQNALLGVTEIRVGIPYPVTAIEILKAELRPEEWRKAVLTGDLFGPGEALARGMVDELRPASEVLSRSLEMAAHLAGSPRETYAAVKRQFRAPALARMAAALEGAEPLAQPWIGPETRIRAAEQLEAMSRRGG